MASEAIEAFGWVEPWLARGGQPEGKQYRFLVDQGVGTIVNLRMHEEAREVEQCAPQLIPIQIAVKNGEAPSDEQALKWLRFCAAIEGRDKIYVHCHAGHGRTSVFCALVRLAQGVDLASALAEETNYGFDPIKERTQVDFLRDFYSRAKSGKITLPKITSSVAKDGAARTGR